MTRAEILSDCPEEFEDRLKEIVDELEKQISNIRDKLQINGIDEIAQLEEAYDLADEMCGELY